jgi:hypothetical protein
MDKECCMSFMQEEKEKLARSETIAIRLSNIANMVLFVAKVYASVRSGSLAIICHFFDLETFYGFIIYTVLFCCLQLINHSRRHSRFPL